MMLMLLLQGFSHPELPERSGVVRVEQLRNLMVFERTGEDRLSFHLLYFGSLFFLVLVFCSAVVQMI